MKKGGKPKAPKQFKDLSFVGPFSFKDIDKSWTSPQWDRTHSNSNKNKTVPYTNKIKITERTEKSPLRSESGLSFTKKNDSKT